MDRQAALYPEGYTTKQTFNLGLAQDSQSIQFHRTVSARTGFSYMGICMPRALYPFPPHEGWISSWFLMVPAWIGAGVCVYGGEVKESQAFDPWRRGCS